jgi:hypothetical protein
MEQELKPAEPQEERMGFFARISGIFFEPKKVFTFLNSKPSWLFAFLLVVLIGAVVAEITLPQSLLLQKEIVSQSPRLSSAPTGTLEKMTQITTAKRVVTFVSEIIRVFLFSLVLLTAVIYFLCNIILGGDSSFKKVLSVVTYTSLVPTLGAILKTPLILVKNSLDVQIGLALLMPAGDFSKIRYMILSTLDIFSIWQIILIAIGITVLYKFSMTKAFITTFVSWALLVFLGIGLSVLGMSASGIPVSW